MPQLSLNQIKDIVAYADAIIEVENRLYPEGTERGPDGIALYNIPLYENGGYEGDPPVATLVDNLSDAAHEDRWSVRIGA